MCGHYSLTTPIDQLLLRLKGPLPQGLAAHYAARPEIAAGEPVLIQRQEHGELQVGLALWGLLPEWQKQPLGSPRPIHARSETVAEKASFRGAWRHRRCLLPADGYREGRGSRCVWVSRRDRQPFWLAGLWDRWIGPDGSEVESCCVLTTRANGLVAPFHPRMPVILPDGLEDAWLQPADGAGLRALEPLLQPAEQGESWQAVPVRVGGRIPPTDRQLALFHS
ncbi:SOS response-associated peptidase [Synechococcus sp. CS-1328]|uniref:SOS response-associated peptidase n=1 Tax=Synechococcus sp. CS-1328 TaxID=2847976 RepID=UPI00223A9C3E|nr:SOS response-associated peptidase [Synechococcus sp. CS-1328]MCT0224858.1 SOS response-associated peptidase [Synechococcus sp. CS-1328]